MFTTHRRPGPGKVLGPRDTCPDTRLARLSYGQARAAYAVIFGHVNANSIVGAACSGLGFGFLTFNLERQLRRHHQDKEGSRREWTTAGSGSRAQGKQGWRGGGQLVSMRGIDRTATRNANAAQHTQTA